MKGFLTDFILLIILLVAAFLRFKGADVYMQDELSAISRLQFDSLAEVIRYGVRPDGHPALMQVWMYLYSALVGYDELSIKTPSIIAGLISVVLVFRIGRGVYGRKVALLAAAMMATLQFFVLYSQLARPYAIGTMLCLWQTHLLAEDAQHPERKMKWWWMMLAMALSAYTHYFSMMVSIIVGIGSFFVLSRSQRVDQIKAVAGAILLFLPHLPITLAQLDKGDLAQAGGWLGPPDKDFFIDFLTYLFHFRPLLIAIMVILGAMMLLGLGTMKGRQRGLTTLFILCGLLPYAIGHIYSIAVGPILQFSLLIFGMPMLLLALLSPLRRMRPVFAIVALSTLLVFNVHSLYSYRQHYTILARQSVDHAVHRIIEFNDRGQRPMVFSTSNEAFLSAYMDRYSLEYDYFLITDSATMSDFDDRSNMVAPQSAVIMINAPLEMEQHLRVSRGDADRWVGNRKSVMILDPTMAVEKDVRQIGFDLSDDAPMPTACSVSAQDLEAGVHEFGPGEEWGPGCKYRLKDILVDGKGIIHQRVEFTDSVAEREVVAVMEIRKAEEVIAWRGRRWSEMGVTGSIYNSWDLEDLLNGRDDQELLGMNTYLWNKDKSERRLYAIDLEVEVIDGMPYSLFESIPSR